MSDTTQKTRPFWSARKDSLVAGCLALLVLGIPAVTLGVWEPWEADVASVASHMIDQGHWLEVHLGQHDTADRSISELPFGYWPVALSTLLLGSSAVAIRLPGLILTVCVLLLLMSTVRRFAGRKAGWLSVLIGLTLPLLCFHGRLALGHSATMMATAAASLMFMRMANKPSTAGSLGAWLLTAVSGLCGGLPGLAIPLGVYLVQSGYGNGPRALTRVYDWLIPILALTLVGLGWWRASIYMPEGMHIETLLLWSDGISQTIKASSRPAFNDFVQQIGFGLFPFGAFLPLALASLLWRTEEEDSNSWIGPVLLSWCVAGFIAPALGIGYSHFGLFLAAPAAAMALAIYFSRMASAPASPVIALITVLLVALLDSNLKHETRLLADTLVGSEIDTFPAYLPGWQAARYLNFLLLGYVILYQGRLHHWMPGFVRHFAYPIKRRPILDLPIVFIALALPIALSIKKSTLAVLISSPYWNYFGTHPNGRRVIIFVAIWLIAYIVFWLLCLLRFRQVGKRTVGKLSSLTEYMSALIDGKAWPFNHAPKRLGISISGLGIVVVITSWMGFMNGPLAMELSTNFSQKEVLSIYQELAVPGEKLFTYRLKGRSGSFYARDLEDLKPADFRKRAKEEERFFALIPRKDLASVNTDFRKATKKKTLPVLDDRGSRYYLVSNQLKDGEIDKNPITNALIEALPNDINKVDINFEDKIELLGWKVEPKQPKSGSPVELHMYWRAKVNRPGTWKIFVHIDAPGERIHGDHDPVAGLHPTQNWKAGELVHDIHKVNIKRTIPAARFTFYAGLYRGKTRLKIKKGPKDKQDRAKLGQIQVR
jgi:hypothetical protein